MQRGRCRTLVPYQVTWEAVHDHVEQLTASDPPAAEETDHRVVSGGLEVARSSSASDLEKAVDQVAGQRFGLPFTSVLRFSFEVYG